VVIVENPIIKDLKYFTAPSEAERFRDHFGHFMFKNRYVGYLTFALNYRFHGLEVTGYHVINIIIHIINALLVYSLVILTFKTPFLSETKMKEKSRHIAVFSALIFVCHPLHTEAVTYIWQRVTSLTALLYLITLVMYIKWRISFFQNNRSDRGGFLKIKPMILYLLSVIAAILAMKTKQTAFTLPVSILLYEVMFFKGPVTRRTLYIIPFILTMTLIPLALIDAGKPLGDMIGDISDVMRDKTDMSRTVYLFTEFRVIMTYLRLLLLPAGQNLDYDYPLYSSFSSPEVFLSLSSIIAFLVTGAYLFFRYRHSVPSVRLISFGIFWFFITLSVESSVIPIANVICEYRMYLPSIGIFLSACTALCLWTEKSGNRWISMSRTGGALLVIIAILAVTTYSRNTVWRDEVTLWKDVVQKSPSKPRAYFGLGNAYLSRGFTEKAVENYMTVIDLSPKFFKVYNNLGTAYQSQGLTDKAVEHFKIAASIKPDDSSSFYNLGNVYRDLGLIDEAIEYYTIAADLDPGFVDVHNNLGNIYQSRGNFKKAVNHFQAVAELEPGRPSSHYNLGNAYQYQGLSDRAIENYMTAIRLNPDFSKAYGNLGVAYHSRGLQDKAIAYFLTALKLDPDIPELYINLGVAYQSKGLNNRAIEQYEKALMLDPDLVKPHYNLGLIYLRQGEKEKAREEFLKVIKIDPRHGGALKFLDSK
jgi:tetratricopeptide (TPR) repeat protein